MIHVIAGSGVAGVTAAQAIKRADPDATVHLFSAERHPYYRRPQLWELIAGRIATEDVFFRPVSWYGQQGIALNLGLPVAAVRPDTHEVSLSDGEVLTYDRLLIATGAQVYVPPCLGIDQEGVFTLRTLDDALAIKAYAKTVSTGIVVGGGLLGLETARALQAAGLDMTVVEVFPYLLPRQLDTEGAGVLQSILEEQKLHVVTGAVTEAVIGNGRAAGIRMQDGRTISGELVLFSAGIRSDAALAVSAGLTVNRGIVVDDTLRSSHADVYAAGDAAEFEGTVYGIIPAAIEQARVAAANMVREEAARYHGTLPSTTLKIGEAEVTSLGECTVDSADTIALRFIDLPAHRYRKLVLRDKLPVGAILLNYHDQLQPVTQLIQRHITIPGDTDRFLTEEIDWSNLLPSSSSRPS
ncbi:MAG: NAD(P)/FAD-dependent oxidoreductase [Chloroflexi bacterium]|nr:NAD(P)/FAD-dependent oxidoreductase [Chloroflexota bacterium]